MTRSQHPHAVTQVLKHFVLPSAWLQPQRIRKRAQAVPEQRKFAAPIELAPLADQRLAIPQLGFPLLPPISAQPARHDHADDADQPEPETKPNYLRPISHQFHSWLTRDGA